MTGVLMWPKAALRRTLLQRSLVSELIVTLDWYRDGPLGLLLLARDEADIIRENITFHLERGVDFVVVTDNGSVDGTRDILAEFSRHANVLVVDEPGEVYDQAQWVGRMFDLAKRHFRAKWVIPADADELWFPADGRYRTDLEKAGNVVRVFWHNMVPSVGTRWQEFSMVGDMWTYNSRSSKVLCATTGFRDISVGNHDVRIVPRVEVESTNLRIYHYPLRSYEQFERKVVNGGRALERNALAPKSWGFHWRDWYAAYQAGGLRSIYEGLSGADTGRPDQTMARYFERARAGISTTTEHVPRVDVPMDVRNLQLG